MKKVLIGFILFPVIFSTVAYAGHGQSLISNEIVRDDVGVRSLQKSGGERALEERPFNPPTPRKCNDPVSGSDGSDPDVVIDLDR